MAVCNGSASEHVTAAKAYLEKGQHDDALQSCKLAIKADKKNYNAYLLTGQTFYQMATYKKSVQAYQAAAKLRPDQAAPHQGMYDVFVAMKSWSHAVTACEAILERIDPKKKRLVIDFRVRLSESLSECGKYETAMEVLVGLLEQAKTATSRHGCLARLVRLAGIQGNPAAEQKYLREILELGAPGAEGYVDAYVKFLMGGTEGNGTLADEHTEELRRLARRYRTSELLSRWALLMEPFALPPASLRPHHTYMHTFPWTAQSRVLWGTMESFGGRACDNPESEEVGGNHLEAGLVHWPEFLPGWLALAAFHARHGRPMACEKCVTQAMLPHRGEGPLLPYRVVGDTPSERNLVRSLYVELAKAYGSVSKTVSVAQTLYKQVLAAHPDDPTARCGAGLLCLRQRDFQGARPYFTVPASAVEGPVEAEAAEHGIWIEYMTTVQQHGEVDPAVAMGLAKNLQSLARWRGETFLYKYRLGVVSGAAGDDPSLVKGAFYHAMRLALLRPEDQDSSQVLAASCLHLAQRDNERGNATRVVRLLERAVITNVIATFSSALDLTEDEIRKMSASKLQEVLERPELEYLAGPVYQRILQVNSRCHWALVGAAQVAHWKKDYSNAIYYYQRALRLDIQNGILWSSLGRCYVATGKYAAALKTFLKACDVLHASGMGHDATKLSLQMPPLREAQYCLAEVYQVLGEADKAKEIFGELYKTAMAERGLGNPQVQVALAYAYGGSCLHASRKFLRAGLFQRALSSAEEGLNHLEVFTETLSGSSSGTAAMLKLMGDLHAMFRYLFPGSDRSSAKKQQTAHLKEAARWYQRALDATKSVKSLSASELVKQRINLESDIALMHQFLADIGQEAESVVSQPLEQARTRWADPLLLAVLPLLATSLDQELLETIRWTQQRDVSAEERARAFARLGILLTRHGHLKHARAAFSTAESHFPQYSSTLAGLAFLETAELGCGGRTGLAAAQRAHQMEHQKYCEAMEQDAGNFFTTLGCAVSGFKCGAHERARLLLEKLERVYPDHPLVLHYLAFCDLRVGHLEEGLRRTGAILSKERHASLPVDVAEASTRLRCRLLCETGRWAEAEERLQTIAVSDGLLGVSDSLRLAMYASRRNDVKKCMMLFSRALKILASVESVEQTKARDEIAVHLLFCRLLNELGNVAEAKAHVAKVVQKFPTSPDAWKAAIKFAIENGEINMAEAALAQLRAVSATLPKDYFRFLGQIRLAKGDFPMYRQTLLSAYHQYPEEKSFWDQLRVYCLHLAPNHELQRGAQLFAASYDPRSFSDCKNISNLYCKADTSGWDETRSTVAKAVLTSIVGLLHCHPYDERVLFYTGFCTYRVARLTGILGYYQKARDLFVRCRGHTGPGPSPSSVPWTLEHRYLFALSCQFQMECVIEVGMRMGKDPPAVSVEALSVAKGLDKTLKEVHATGSMACTLEWLPVMEAYVRNDSQTAPVVYIMVGRSLSVAKKYDDAEKAIKSAIACVPRSAEENLFLTVRFVIELANMKLRADDEQAAAEMYRTALRMLDVTDTAEASSKVKIDTILFRKSLCAEKAYCMAELARLQSTGNSLKWLHQANSILPSTAFTIAMTSHLIDLGEYDRAQQVLELPRITRNATYYGLRATIYAHHGRWSQVRAHCERAFELGNMSGDIRSLYARGLVEGDMISNGLNEFRKAIHLEPWVSKFRHQHTKALKKAAKQISKPRK